MSKNTFLRQYNSPNIVIEPTESLPCAPMMNQPKAKKKYFNEYKSPNIVIVPTATTCNPPSPKRIKLDTIPPNQSPEHIDISFLDDFNIDEIVACLNNCDNIQETETNYEINQTAQYEPIEQTVLNKNDLIKPHEDSINNDTNIDDVEDSLKPVENKNLTNIKINGYERVEKSNKTVFEIDKRSKEETNFKKNNDHTQIDIRCTERPSPMVTCESVEHKKERTKPKPENDIDNCIIININVDLVVNGCRDVKKGLKSKSATVNETIIKDQHAESGKTESKTSKDTTGIEERKKLKSKSKITLDKTSMEEKKISGAKSKTIDVTSIEEYKKKIEGEPKTTIHINAIEEKKNLEGESKANIDITSIKKNIKLEGELTTGEVITVDITPIKENKNVVGEPNTTIDIGSAEKTKKLEGKPKTTIDIVSAEKTKKLEDEPNTTVDITFIKENKNVVGEPNTTIDIGSAEKTKKLEGETKATVDITSIKENIKLEGELTTGEVITVDITPIKKNKNVVGEPNTTVDVTFIKENRKIEGKPKTTIDIVSAEKTKKLEDEPNTTVDITFIKENKKLEGEHKTTIDIASAEKSNKYEGETKSTVDITSIKENIKLEGELTTGEVTTVDITPIMENKNLVGEPKTTVDITAIKENKKFVGEPNTTKDKTSIQKNKRLESEPKTTVDIAYAEKTFKTEVNKSSIASAKTDVLELIKLEQQMYNFLHKKFSVLSTIHCGNYSKIFKCKDSIGKDYAVKMLNKNCHKLNGSSKEIMLQNIQLDIPKKNLFCVYLYGSFAFNGHWCFLQEYYPKNLNQAIEESAKPFDINTTQDLASQLVGAVLLLRNNNIVHSDIKPNHILLNSTNTKLKLCGFDNASYLNNNTLSNTGALNYRPPEVILGCPAGFSIDVWSTALVLYEMVTGNKLFPGYSNSDMLYRQMKVLGSIPEEMLSISLFRNKYFYRDRFLKLSYYNKFLRSISINDFTGDNTIHNSVHHVYKIHWGTRDQKDQKKLDMFLSLLKKMLVLHPKRRLSIEFVCANPFIYELFSN